jgi:hypothetical protein
VADSSFVVKNTLVVNNSFTVNSTSLVHGSNTLSIGTSAYYIANGNIGLGNSSPAHKLSVNGNSYFGGTVNAISNVSISGTSFFNGNIVITSTAGISANGGYGSQGQALISNGSSVYWATATAGSNTYIQFNDSNTAGASAGLTFNKVTNTVNIANSLVLGNNLSLSNSIILGNMTINNTGISQNTFSIGTAAYFIASGNAGIGTSSPAYKLDVAGVINARGDIYTTKGSSPYIGAADNYNLRLGTGLADRAVLDTGSNFTAYGNITAYSDERLKTDIETISNALEKVCKMRGVMYTRIDTETRGSGVIAQEMQEVLPEVVLDTNEYLSVAYGNIVGILIEAIKELKAEIDQLKGK